MRPSIIFLAQTIKGSGRGKRLGSPTMNLALDQVPETLKEGVYAVRACIGEGEWYPATMHYGPRPTFGDIVSCEVHLLEVTGCRLQVVGNITVEVVERLRDIQKFESEEALKKQIAEDIAKAKEILNLPPKT